MKPAVVVLLVCAAGLAACSPGPGAGEVRRGREVFLARSCPACHGAERQGSAAAPPLKGLRWHWNRESMEAFLRSPWTYRKGSGRLQALADRYPGDMPGVGANADPAEVRALVSYLLDP